MNRQQQEQILAYARTHGYDDTLPRYQSCQVRVTLSQPIGGYDPIHLDGLLQSAVVLDALEGIPLERSSTPYTIPLPLEVLWRSPDGLPLYQCSSLLPVGRVKSSIFTWTKKNEESVSRFAARKKDGTEWQPDNGSGQHKEYCMPLPVKSSTSLIGYAVGDLEEISRLLKLLPALGKKTAWGLGSIANVAINPCSRVSRFCFVREQRLLRPVPVVACQDLGLAVTGEPQFAGYTPPYWLPANQANCFLEQQAVSDASPAHPPGREQMSIPAFLHRCSLADSARHMARGALTLLHPKYVSGSGVGALCALTGMPITDDGAVPSRFALSRDMGNVADFCRAPESPWVSNAAALILSQPKQMHRNLVALLHPTTGEAHLLWPSIAVDPTNPKQARPLWREVLLALLERYQGYQCILIFKDEPKSRTWPRARIGVVGERTPLLMKESQFGIEALVQISIPEVVRQMLSIEDLLDAGYGKMEIRYGLKSPALDRLIETLESEKKLIAMRATPEFPLAWHSARTKEDRALRKDIPVELD